MELISKYRTHLMGFSIIWVMAFHLAAQGKESFDFFILNPIIGNGYGGVDIFLFLSGIGLVRSWNGCLKAGSIIEALKLFYLKRLKRLFPAYIIVCLIYIGIRQLNLVHGILCISTIGHWIGIGRYDWYIPTILVYYLIFPFLYKILIRNGKVTVVCTFFTVVAICLCLFMEYPYIEDVRVFSLSRLPIFCLGIYWGINLEKFFEKRNVIIWYVLMCVGCMLLFYFKHSTYGFTLTCGAFQLPFFLITPGLCIILVRIFRKLPSYFNRLFLFCGIMSLELYLVHLKLFENIYGLPYFTLEYRYVYVLVLAIIVLVLSYLLNRSISKFMNKKY